MYLLERQKKILSLLLHSQEWITGAGIGKALNITDRTVRNDVRDINEELKVYQGSHIESVRGKGYLLVTREKEKLLEQVEKTNANETTKGRLCNMALEILMTRDPILLDDLEDEFFISRTTLEATIKSINEKCMYKCPEPVLQHKKNAIFPNCREQTKRELMRSFIVVSRDSAGQTLKDEYGFLDTAQTKKIMLHIRKNLAEWGLRLTDTDMIEATLQIYIQSLRIQEGSILDSVSAACPETLPATIREISDKLIDDIGVDMGISYTETEREALAAYLCGIRMMKAERFTREEIASIIEPCYIVIVEELLHDIKNEFMLDLTQDDRLFVDLVMHIRFSIKTGNSSGHQENPLLDTIKNRYPFVFELSTYIFSRFYDVLGVELDENQLSYVAAHLGAALERLENTTSSSDFKVAVCSNMSMGMVRLLMAKLHSLYTNRMDIMGPYPVYDVESMMKDNPSLVLTTTSSSLFRNMQVPAITISPMLEPEDILAINNSIGKIKRDSVISTLPKGVEQYFEEDLFFPQVELGSQTEVLEFLSGKIVEKGYASEELLANTLEREKIAPTTFANQIAMPHPMRICAYKTVIAVATLKKPVFWGNLNAQLIFMLVVRSSDMKYLNGFFDITAKLVWEKKKVHKLTETVDFQAFIEEML